MAKSTPKKTRKLQEPKYKSFRLQKRIKTVKPKLPSIKVLSQQTADILKENKKFFIIFSAMYGGFSFLFIQSASATLNISEAREIIGDSLGGALPTSIALYAELIGNSTQFTNQIVALYQFIIILIFSLAVIYGLRHMYGKQAQKVSVKASLYKGMTPLVPILLVLAVIGLQFLPLSVGSSIYASVIGAGLAITSIERVFWVLFVGLTGLMTLYLISGSIFALFIVTLPDMTPMRALRASRELVRFRRLEVIRKVVFLPFALLVLLGLVVIPFIAVLPGLAQLVFLVASALVLPIVLTYMYNLYRSML